MQLPQAGSILVYDRIGANKRETWLLMFGFFALVCGLVAVLLLSFGVPPYQMPGALGLTGIFLIVYAMISYFASTGIVLSISGAHEVTKEDEWEFVRRVENLCIGAGLPMPN